MGGKFIPPRVLPLRGVRVKNEWVFTSVSPLHLYAAVAGFTGIFTFVFGDENRITKYSPVLVSVI